VICEKCDQRAVLIPEHEGLIAAAAIGRVMMPLKLDGSEIRFVRKALGWTAAQLAERIDVTPETISRWEQGHSAISPKCETHLRIVAASTLSELAPAIDVDLMKIGKMQVCSVRESSEPVLMEFELVKVKQEHQKAFSWDTMDEGHMARAS